MRFDRNRRAYLRLARAQANDEYDLAHTERQLRRIERWYEPGEDMHPDDDDYHVDLSDARDRLNERISDHAATREDIDREIRGR